MAEKRGADPDKQVIDSKTGRGGFKWKGLALDTEPSDLPADTPRQLTNMRLVGGRIESRGGQLQLCDITAEVTGMHDLGTGADRGLYILERLHEEADPSLNGMGLSIYNEEKADPFVNIGTYYDGQFTLDYGGSMASYGSDVLFCFEDGISDLALKKISTEDSTVQEVVAYIPSGFVTSSAMLEHEGEAIIALVGDPENIVADSAIYKWNGTTLAPELESINRVYDFAKFRDTLVATVATAPNSVRVRSSSGTWSAGITPGAGDVGDLLCSYRDLLYCIDSSTGMFITFNGSTFSQVTSATIGIDALDIIANAVRFEDKLYFIWKDTSAELWYVGVFDGTTWNPTLKNITEVPIVTVSNMKVYKSSIWITGVTATAPYMASSVFDDIDGTWKDRSPAEYVSGARGVTSFMPY